MRWILSLALAIPGGSGCASAPRETQASEIGNVYRTLVHFLGEPSLSVGDRYAARDLLFSCKDERVIPFLVEGTTDERVFDPEAERPSGSPEDPPYVKLVRHECSQLLHRWFVQDVRSRYRVKNWKEWWARHKHLPIDKIRAMIKKEEESR